MAPGSRKKKEGVNGSDPIAQITDDILADIISRVPYKSTCCCKCVSTRWRDLISHPDHRKKMAQSLAGFFYQGFTIDPIPKTACYLTNVSGEGHHLIDPSLSFLPKCQSLDILDCCNGLLLCRRWKTVDTKAMDYVVCNPATQKWVLVPATDWSSQVDVARLGFDPAVSSHFHVFEFIEEEVWGIDESELSNCDGAIETLAIYSSKAGAWKHQTVEHGPFAVRMMSKSVFLNGILHLAAFDNLIVAVDAEGVNWWLLDIPSLPQHYTNHDDVIFASQGKLCVVNIAAGSDGSELEVWVLEDYVTERWTLKRNVSHSQLFGNEYPLYADDFSVISIHPEYNLIFIVGGEKKTLMSCDMDSMKRHFIRQLGLDCQAELYGWRVTSPFFPYVPWFSESLADGR